MRRDGRRKRARWRGGHPAGPGGSVAAPALATARLAIRVIKGEGVLNFQGQPADTRVVVTCEGVAFSSKVVQQDASPEWNLSCSFDLRRPDPLGARISITVRSKIAPWHRASIACYESDLEALVHAAHGTVVDESDQADVRQSLSRPAWLELTHKGRPAGRLQVQVHFVKDIQHRPLRVLAVTWNVGDAPPSDSLQFCFPNIASGMYDLVVVGAQEVPSNALPKGADSATASAGDADVWSSEALTRGLASDTSPRRPEEGGDPRLRSLDRTVAAQRGSGNDSSVSSLQSQLPAPAWQRATSQGGSPQGSEQELRGRSYKRQLGGSCVVRSPVEGAAQQRALSRAASASPRSRALGAAGGPRLLLAGRRATEATPEGPEGSTSWCGEGGRSNDEASLRPSSWRSQLRETRSSFEPIAEREEAPGRPFNRRSWTLFAGNSQSRSGRLSDTATDPGRGDADASSASASTSPKRLETASPMRRGKSNLILQPVPPELLESLRQFAREGGDPEDMAVVWRAALMGARAQPPATPAAPAAPAHSSQALDSGREAAVSDTAAGVGRRRDGSPEESGGSAHLAKAHSAPDVAEASSDASAAPAAEHSAPSRPPLAPTAWKAAHRSAHTAPLPSMPAEPCASGVSSTGAEGLAGDSQTRHAQERASKAGPQDRDGLNEFLGEPLRGRDAARRADSEPAALPPSLVRFANRAALSETLGGHATDGAPSAHPGSAPCEGRRLTGAAAAVDGEDGGLDVTLRHDPTVVRSCDSSFVAPAAAGAGGMRRSMSAQALLGGDGPPRSLQDSVNVPAHTARPDERSDSPPRQARQLARPFSLSLKRLANSAALSGSSHSQDVDVTSSRAERSGVSSTAPRQPAEPGHADVADVPTLATDLAPPDVAAVSLPPDVRGACETVQAWVRSLDTEDRPSLGEASDGTLTTPGTLASESQGSENIPPATQPAHTAGSELAATEGVCRTQAAAAPDADHSAEQPACLSSDGGARRPAPLSVAFMTDNPLSRSSAGASEPVDSVAGSSHGLDAVPEPPPPATRAIPLPMGGATLPSAFEGTGGRRVGALRPPSCCGAPPPAVSADAHRPVGSSKFAGFASSMRVLSDDDTQCLSPESAPGELLAWRAAPEADDSTGRRKHKLRRWLTRILRRPEPPAPVAAGKSPDASDSIEASASPQASGRHRLRHIPVLSTRNDATKPTKVDTNAWDDLVTAAIGGNYLIVKSVSIGQMRLAVFARSDMFAAVSQVEADAVATGFGGVGTNKGAAAIACKVWGNHLAFVNCHLAAHQAKSLDRNKMYQEIVKGLRIGHEGMDVHTSFQHLLWMGDLNYRIDYPGAWRDDEAPSDEMLKVFIEHLEAGVLSSDYSHFLGMDQLRTVQRDNAAFADFSEGPIAFPPTFKVERGGELSYQSKRLPAWCDRILWHSNMPLGQRPTCVQYHSSQAVGTSDHKPVFAVLDIPSVSAPPEVVHDTLSHLGLVVSSLRAEGLDQSKMMLTLRKRVQGVHAFVAAVKHMCRKDDGCGLWVSFGGDDVDHAAPSMATSTTSHTSWKGQIRVQLKHAYHAHLRGRLLLLQIRYSTGRKGAETRTIGRAVLPFCAVMPDNADLSSSAWHADNAKREFPFCVQVYHRGLRAGKLTGTVRWVLRSAAMTSMLDLMKPVARMSAAVQPKRNRGLQCGSPRAQLQPLHLGLRRLSEGGALVALSGDQSLGHAADRTS